MSRRRQLLPLLLAAAVTIQPAPADAQAGLAGSYRLDAAASDDINQAINLAIADMNFFIRQIARPRLRDTNQPYRSVTIGIYGRQVAFQTEKRAPIVTNAGAAPVAWTREDGETLEVSSQLEGSVLTQTYQAEDGQRTNVFTLGANGNTLSMRVTVTSPRLPDPLTYTLRYLRVD